MDSSCLFHWFYYMYSDMTLKDAQCLIYQFISQIIILVKKLKNPDADLLKDIAWVTHQYLANLERYILENQETYFEDEKWRAKSWCDYVDFGGGRPFTRRTLCMPNEPMLIDRSVDGVFMYCVCTIWEDRKVKKEIPVMRIHGILKKNWRNWYFLLPVL